MMDTEDATALKVKAEEMYGWLERRKRNDDETFITFKEGAPDWVRDVVFAAHDDMFADDTKYAYVRDALEAITETADFEDAIEYMDTRVEVYNSNMAKWLASHLARAEYVDEAVQSYGYKDLWSALQWGMLEERRQVLDIVYRELERRVQQDREATDEQEG